MRHVAGEQGAVAVTVALTFTVVLAAFALVLDGGALRAETVQLQNGADASALAIARGCAFGLSTCSTSSTDLSSYLAKNADDGTSNGTATIDAANHRVTVKATPRDAESGKASVPYRLASAVGVESGTTTASATAGWVPRVKPHFAPVPVSRCEFDTATSSSKTTTHRYPGLQPLTAIYYRSGGCGGDVPDGITAVVPALGIIRTETQCNPPSGCSEDEMAPEIGREISLAIWSRDTYGNWKLDGLAGFHLTSFFRNNGQKVGTGPCAANNCISGWFTRTSRRDGLPGGYQLGGEVDLVK